MSAVPRPRAVPRVPAERAHGNVMAGAPQQRLVVAMAVLLVVAAGALAGLLRVADRPVDAGASLMVSSGDTVEVVNGGPTPLHGVLVATARGASTNTPVDVPAGGRRTVQLATPPSCSGSMLVELQGAGTPPETVKVACRAPGAP